MRSLFTENRINAFSKNWIWFLLWGLVLTVLGVVALYYDTLTTLLTVLILGVVIFIGGIVVLVDAFSFWWGKWGGFLLHLIMGLLYLIVGYMLFRGPLVGAISLTLFLGVFYVVIGLLRIFYSLTVRIHQKWGWSFFNGLVALILGILIVSQWPASSLYIIGLFVGIDLIVTGWTYVMAALAGRALAKGA